MLDFPRVRDSIGVLISISLLSLTLPLSALAQVTFHRTFGGRRYDSGNDVHQTSDGGYAICGTSMSVGIGLFMDMYLVKTDSLGQLQWQKTYGGTINDFATALCTTSDGGYLVVGATECFGKGRHSAPDVYVVKTDSIGDTVWTRTHGGEEYDAGCCVSETHDRGYVIVGSESSSGPGLWDVFLIRMDRFGNTLWTRTYGGGSYEEGFSVQQTTDFGYIIAGVSASFGEGDTDVYLVKTDSVGEILWTRTYGGTENDVGRSVWQTPDRGYVVAGYTTTEISGRDVYLIRTDSLGNALWTRRHDMGGTDLGYQVRWTPDGGYIVAGGGGDVYLIKTDSLGDTLWTRALGGKSEDCGYSLEQTTDGGFVVAGRTASFGAGSYDMYLIKTDPDGVSELRDASTLSIDAPTGRVFSDSAYPVAATVANLGQSAMTFDVEAVIGDYVDTVKVVDLSVDSTAPVRFEDWLVPSADSAVYRVTVCTCIPYDFNDSNDCAQSQIFGFKASHDVGMVRVDSPPLVVLTDSTYAVAFTVRNYGDFPETFRVQCAIDGYSDERRVRLLPPGATLQVSLRDWTVPSGACTTYTMKYFAYMPYDDNTSNDGGAALVCAHEGEGPLILSAFASDNVNPIPGVDDDDYVLVTFDEGTNRATIDANNIDDVLRLTNGHSWRDGLKSIRSAEWNHAGDSLFIFLSATISPPTVTVGDMIMPDGATIRDKWGTPTSCSNLITGSFEPPGIEEIIYPRAPGFSRLFQNHPNPFDDLTTIRYFIAGREGARVRVRLTVQDVVGRVVETIVDQDQSPGVYQVGWFSDGNRGGTYFCRLQTDDFEDVKKMILLR